MKLLFVDTAAWMSMADGADPAHDAIGSERDDWLRQGGVLLTSDYVLDETLTLIRMRLGIRAARQWWALLDSSRRLRVEWTTPERAARARTWFFGWADMDFSFTDCTSFVLMRELRMRHALTSDDHFRQAGFEVLP